jgi:signal transduction histidine kinase
VNAHRWPRPSTGDLLLGLILAAVSIAHIYVASDVDRSRALLVALSVLIAVSLGWRRTAPLASGMAISVFFAILLAGDYPDGMPGLSVSVILSSYSIGAHIPRASIAVIPLVILLAAGWYDDIRREHPPGQYVSSFMVLGVPWIGGRVLRRQRLQASELQELTAELETQRDQIARAAVVEERSRIARELHDVVAHSISVIAVQAGGARSTLKEQPESARESIEVVRRTSSEALGEMRRILQVLRGRDGGSSAPQPGVKTLAQLVREVEREGTPVRLSVQGADRLPETLDLNAYRIVQEALTNVRKHAGPGASAEVTISADGRLLTIVVQDDGAGSSGNGGPSQGLSGIRERAELFGGTMDAGNRSGGGFEVRVRIPVPR